MLNALSFDFGIAEMSLASSGVSSAEPLKCYDGRKTLSHRCGSCTAKWPRPWSDSSRRRTPSSGMMIAQSKTLATSHDRGVPKQSAPKFKLLVRLVENGRPRYTLHVCCDCSLGALTDRFKCDSLRPCSQCVSKSITCEYKTRHGETHLQASKRKHDEISRSHDAYLELFGTIRTRNEPEAAEAFRRLRNGQHPEAILQFLRTGDAVAVTPDPKRVALEAFLVSLAHSKWTEGQDGYVMPKPREALPVCRASRLRAMLTDHLFAFRHGVTSRDYQARNLSLKLLCRSATTQCR